MKKEYIIFKGKAEVTTGYVGTVFYPRQRKDRFGTLEKGEHRLVRAQNKDIYIRLPHKFGNKKIEIIIRETGEP